MHRYLQSSIIFHVFTASDIFSVQEANLSYERSAYSVATPLSPPLEALIVL